MSTAPSPATTKPQPLRVFISYAHADSKLCEKFVKALAQLQRDGLIDGWDDRGIAAGDDWAGVIDERLQSAEIVVLLVSSNFLASNYCNEIELQTALQRHAAGLARVIPVILKPCDWESSRFGKLQALPKLGKPVVDWKTEDHGFTNVVKGLRSVATQLRKGADPQSSAPHFVPTKLRHRWPLIAGIAALALISVIAVFFWTKHQSTELVAQGNATLFDHTKSQETESVYRRAIKLDTKNAEAYFGLGTLYDLQKDPENAAKMFEQAAKLSPRPEYKNNLADEYFKLGQYKRAADEYDQIPEFPAAALESAKINRLRNNLDVAEDRNKLAITWLNDPRIANAPENKLPWYFLLDEEHGTRIITAEEKICYAGYELAITLFLKGNSPTAPTCGEGHSVDIKAQLKSELERLANEQTELAGRSKEYINQYLESAITKVQDK